MTIAKVGDPLAIEADMMQTIVPAYREFRDQMLTSGLASDIERLNLDTFIEDVLRYMFPQNNVGDVLMVNMLNCNQRGINLPAQFAKDLLEAAFATPEETLQTVRKLIVRAMFAGVACGVLQTMAIAEQNLLEDFADDPEAQKLIDETTNTLYGMAATHVKRKREN